MRKMKYFLYILDFSLLLIVLFLVYLISASLNKNSLADKKTQNIDQSTTIQTKKIENQTAGVDLSYIMIRVDGDAKVILTNANGIEVGEQKIEEPIRDPKGQSISAAKLLNALDYSKPKSSQYTLQVIASNKDKFVLDVYFYDREGKVNTKTFTERLVNEVNYIIKFDKNNSANSSIERKQ